MNHFIKYIQQKDDVFYFIALLLVFPALFYNLGVMPLMSDEGIRGLVSLEMIFSDNYYTPTLNGEFYYNKPPLYNWIMVVFFKLYGNYSETALRMPMTIGTLLFAFTIFVFLRKRVGYKLSIINALAFVTCGRMLFNDTFLGLIDITYSWITYMSFISIYYFHKKGQYYWLFVFSYFFAAIGFMMKGLPAIVFQGITLLVFFIYQRQYKKLFTLSHLLGIGFFTSIILLFIFEYSKYNDPENYLSILWGQSAERTILSNEIWKSILHIIRFPLIMIYEILPWSLLIITCFRKDFFRVINSKPYIRFSFWIVVSNIIIYWLSPGFNARYIFMLFPLILTVLLYFFTKAQQEKKVLYRSTIITITTIMAIGVLTQIAILFLPQSKLIPNMYINIAIYFMVLGGIFFLFLKLPNAKLILLILFLLVIRIEINHIAMPIYSKTIKEHQFREKAVEVAHTTLNNPLYLYKSPIINRDISYYITRIRCEILQKKHSGFNNQEFYIIDENQLKTLNKAEYKIYKEFYTRHENITLYLIKLNDIK